MDRLSAVDIETIESLSVSHLGEEYTELLLRGGERVTINERFADVKRRLVNKNQEHQVGEVVSA